GERRRHLRRHRPVADEIGKAQLRHDSGPSGSRRMTHDRRRGASTPACRSPIINHRSSWSVPAMTAIDLSPFASATEMLVALRRREVSAVELLDLHLRRIERYNPAL